MVSKKLGLAVAVAIAVLVLFAQLTTATPPNPSISAPLSGAAVSGTVEIEGTAAGPDFGFYKVEYKAPGSTTWVWVDGETHDTPVTDDVLATWDVTKLPAGVYALRVLAADAGGQYNTTQISVNVNQGATAEGAVQADPNTVVAVPVNGAVDLNKLAADPAWANAPTTTVKLSGGMNFPNGETTATIKSVYSGDMIYFLVQYDDSTQSFRRSPFVKQADGSWVKLKDPDDKGGDNNKYYEDKTAMIWDINGITGFQQQGCMATCHVGEPGKAFGNKYAPKEGELGDIWHLKLVRTGPVGQTDDQYLDATRYDAKTAPEAGRKSDPKTSGGYTDVALKNGVPEFMSQNGPAANAGGTYWILNQNKVAFNNNLFNAGDEVASIAIAPFTGDRGDLPTVASWQDGKWTLAIGRKLFTGSKYDVQFSDLSKPYYFGLSAFNNAQVRHAYSTSALKLVFAQAGQKIEQVAAQPGTAAGGPPNIPANHATSGCLVCHATGAAGAPKFPDSHVAFTENQCTTCHVAK
ncbi:MAG: hypothetical protein HY741_06020 [Chloroflexi bacterium]|nr:hypothetical protein [Chloroflexota bacterium]